MSGSLQVLDTEACYEVDKKGHVQEPPVSHHFKRNVRHWNSLMHSPWSNSRPNAGCEDSHGQPWVSLSCA